MTRQEAIERVGLKAVEAVEKLNCEPTSRAYDHEYGEIEWVASVKVDYSGLTEEMVYNLPMCGCRLAAYYYTTASDSEAVEASGGDWGAINWEVDSYEIE